MTDKLYKYQKLWLKYLRELGCNIDTAKDIVQEFYIKMHTSPYDYLYNETEPNFYGCYLILRNMLFDLKRKEKKYSITTDENLKDQTEIINLGSEDLEEKYLALSKWLNINSVVTDNETFVYDSSVLKKIYYMTIFEEVFQNNKKISVLSRETNISYYSLYNTVQKIKEQIKKIYEE